MNEREREGGGERDRKVKERHKRKATDQERKEEQRSVVSVSQKQFPFTTLAGPEVVAESTENILGISCHSKQPPESPLHSSLTFCPPP